jgi:hypothetical protein
MRVKVPLILMLHDARRAVSKALKIGALSVVKDTLGDRVETFE